LTIALASFCLFFSSCPVLAQNTSPTATPTPRANECDPDVPTSCPNQSYCEPYTDDSSYYYACTPILSPSIATTPNPAVCNKGLDKKGELTNDPDKIVRCLEVNTAIGNISTEPQGFVRFIFGAVLGLAGGIALILIIISGYKLMASQGNPEGTKAALEQLTSAIIGLLFIILSFVILQIIGVDILRIPGFSP